MRVVFGLKNAAAAVAVVAPNLWWSIVVDVEIAEHKNSCFHADNDDVLRAPQCVCVCVSVYQAENNEIASMQIYPLNRIERCLHPHCTYSAALEWTNIICVRWVDGRWVGEWASVHLMQ